MRATEQDRPDVAHDRRRWRVWQRYMDPDRFVFLDETGASTNMVRRYGRCPRGERLVDTTPHGHWMTTTFVAGLRASGVIVPMVLVMDNLAAHKVAGVKDAIRAAGASVLYLPSYSPDLNPIEQFFAKLKAMLRSAASRTKDALWDTIGRALDAFPEAECRNYLAHCGYEFT